MEREQVISASTFKRSAMGVSEIPSQKHQLTQKATATLFRMDAADPTVSTAARESSLTKGYDALGAAEFHRLDEDDWRRGPVSRPPSQGGLSRLNGANNGSLSPPAPRLRGPLSAASAMVMDLGKGAAPGAGGGGAAGGRAEQPAAWPAAAAMDLLNHSSSSSGLRVTKALPPALAAAVPRTSSGSLAWSMRMARSAAKRSGFAEAF